MLNVSVLLAIVLVGYAFYSAATIITNRRKARLLGCQPAHVQKNRLPLGWDQLQRLRAADAAGNVPEEMRNMFKEEGRWTFKSSMLGSTFVQTAEPRNIQAILATQFKDFELGDLRRRVLYPMLGDGIFTADGKYWWGLPYWTMSQGENLTGWGTGNTQGPCFDPSSLETKLQIFSWKKLMYRSSFTSYQPTSMAGPDRSISPLCSFG